MKKVVILVFILAVVLGILFWIYGNSFLGGTTNAPSGPITLTFLGLSEDERVYKPIFTAYHNIHPNVSIQFVSQDSINYRTRLQTQIEAGKAPDIVKIHDSWIPMFKGDLSPAPSDIFTPDEFSQTFYPIASKTLIADNKVLAVPEDLDGLVLYVNQDILTAAGLTPPTNWVDFIDDARKTTVKDTNGQIQTAGAALGTTTNVDFWPEILGLLFLQQPDGNLASPSSNAGVEVLQFFTSFVTNPNNKVWDVTLPSSTTMFSQGKLTFYFGPYYQASQILAANPNLHFKAVPVPQLPGKQVAWGEFWAFGVSSTSAHPEEAWNFLKYLDSAAALQQIRSDKFQLGMAGGPYPRVDMMDQQLNDPIYGAFVSQGSYYQGWYLNSNTGDDGLNELMIGLFKTAVYNVLQGNDPAHELQNLQTSEQQILKKYEISF